MASLDNMREAERSNSEGSNKDVEIAVRMTIQMLQDGGLETIDTAIKQSQDPAQVVGQFLAQIVGALAQKLYEEMQIDPRIFLADDGWLDKILDYIETELGFPDEFSDQIYAQVLEVIKAAASEGQGTPGATASEGTPQGLEGMSPDGSPSQVVAEAPING